MNDGASRWRDTRFSAALIVLTIVPLGSYHTSQGTRQEHATLHPTRPPTPYPTEWTRLPTPVPSGTPMQDQHDDMREWILEQGSRTNAPAGVQVGLPYLGNVADLSLMQLDSVGARIEVTTAAASSRLQRWSH